MLDMDSGAETLFQTQLKDAVGKGIQVLLPHIIMPDDPEDLTESVKIRFVIITKVFFFFLNYPYMHE